jgi:beta-lactamase class D
VAYVFRCGCLWLLLAAGPGTAEPATDLGALLAAEGVDPATSALLVVRLDDGREWHSNPRRVDARFVPASTSKIPHTLIALETGYADGPDKHFSWDGTVHPFPTWNQDQTLASAYRHSAVWVYQKIASDIGSETMGAWLTHFDYGNHEVGGPDDVMSYWLDGPLAISAREQVAFLTRLAQNELPIDRETRVLARSIMQADAGPGWTLYAKTGWGAGNGDDIGWYVGWVEADPGPDWVFAFNLDMPDEEARARRIPLVRAVLTELGAIANKEN